jgi:oligoendopeptidase F
MKFTTGILTLAVALPLLAAPPKGFEPIPSKETALWRFDLKKNFYADEAAWKADCDRFTALSAKIEAYKGKVVESPEYLLAVMDAQKEATDVLYRLYAYGEFREAVNTDDRVPYETYERLKADAEAKNSFVRVELKGLKPDDEEAFLKQRTGLIPFKYLIEDAMRNAPHTLTTNQEALLSTVGPDLTSWQEGLFLKTFSRAAFSTIKADGREYDVHRDFEALMRNPDRTVRERAFKECYAGMKAINDLAGFSLLHLMRAYNTEAKLRGFGNHYEESLFDRYLSRPQVDNLYAQIESHLPLYQAYQRLRMEEAKKLNDGKEAEIWDMDRQAPGAELPRYDAPEGCKLVLDSLSVLGPEYAADLGKLLDPRNSRLDIVGGPGRMEGAFTEAQFGFYMDTYEGYLDNVSTLAHESGHAIHAQLVLDHRGALLFHEGPGYMTESFAMFNEWLLRDHLLKTLKDEAVKKTIRRDGLNEMMYLWELARRAKFEMVSYDRVASGQITDEKGFNQACVDTGKVYDLFFSRDPDLLSVHWMRKQHYWTNPTYYLNYVVAQLLALKYYQLYLADPKGFPSKYTAMVAAGFEKPANEMLKSYLGVDLNDPKLLDDTFTLLQKRFDEVAKAN